MKTTDWDKLTTSGVPNNTTAAKVVGPGTHYDPEVNYTRPHYTDCPRFSPAERLG